MTRRGKCIFALHNIHILRRRCSESLPRVTGASREKRLGFRMAREWPCTPSHRPTDTRRRASCSSSRSRYLPFVVHYYSGFFHGTKVAWYKFMLCFWKLQAILTTRGKGEENCCQVILRGALCLVNVVRDKLSSTIPSRISGGFFHTVLLIDDISTGSSRFYRTIWAELGLVRRKEVHFSLRCWRASSYEDTQKSARWILNYSIDLITRMSQEDPGSFCTFEFGRAIIYLWCALNFME